MKHLKKYWSIALIVFIFLVLATLKLIGIIHWDWCIITSPLWGAASFFVVAGLIIGSISDEGNTKEY